MGSVLRARVSQRGGRLVSDRGQDYKMAAGGAWRRPRMKVYDYNQEFGGNYYQPMIQYLNKKDIYGPFHKRTEVYLPHSAEVTSAKYTNMRTRTSHLPSTIWMTSSRMLTLSRSRSSMAPQPWPA